MPTILAVTVFLAAAVNAALCYWYLQCVRSQQRLQAQASLVNQRQAMFQSLGRESLEYSRKNPAIIPLLQSFGMQLKPAEPK